MRAPRRDAFQMRLVEIARPPDDVGRVAGEMHHMLAGAAAGLQHVAGFAGEEFLQHRPDRRMVAVERRRVEPAVGFDRPAILAEFHHILSHSKIFTSDRRNRFPSAPAARARRARRRRDNAASARSRRNSTRPSARNFAKMLRQRRLAELDDVDQFADRHLATHGEKAKDQQALFVGRAISAAARPRRPVLPVSSVPPRHRRAFPVACFFAVAATALIASISGSCCRRRRRRIVSVYRGAPLFSID